MVNRYQRENSFILEETSTSAPMKRKKHNTFEVLTLKLENEELRHQLELARLKLEGYQIMGYILSEEYGIDLLKSQKPSSLSTQRTTPGTRFSSKRIKIEHSKNKEL